MSTFLGHSITGAGVFFSNRKLHKSSLKEVGWLIWLIVVAYAPDLDQYLGFLGRMNHSEGVRVTHSLFSAFVLPVYTVLGLYIMGTDLQRRYVRIIQVFWASFSHMILDLLTGAIPLPLFWPFSNFQLLLPFGILPPVIATNFASLEFYRNLLIEAGVLIPILVIIYARFNLPGVMARRSPRLTTILLAVSACFMLWGLLLPR